VDTLISPVHGGADLLSALAEHPRVRCRRRWGNRHRLRRWMNVTGTPLRFTEEGSLFRRVVIGFGFATFGLPVQWLVDRSTKGTAIVAYDGRSGLDLRQTGHADEPVWMIARFWAWPIGNGHSRTVSTALVEAADRTGSRLVLQAGNQHLAREFYAPLGFAYQPGQERVRRPRLIREPVSSDIGNSCPRGQENSVAADLALVRLGPQGPPWP
jgi:hypothetical protein